jgi:hypothetical protein
MRNSDVPRSRRAALIAVSLSLFALRPASSQQPPAPDLAPRTLAALASKYIADYRAKFAFLIADEEYVQVVSDTSGNERERRTLKGELFLTFLEVDNEWVAVHDFATVGGRPVTDREDIRALLQKNTSVSILRNIAGRNARFNIGRVERDFNEPTLALLVLEDKRIRNFRIGRKLVTRDGDATLAVLDFTERERPTIVFSLQRGPVFSRGDITIEAATGRVRRTRIEFEDGPILAELTTTYALDPKLDLWVPSVFTERYQVKDGGPPEVIRCEAKYTNYRRFMATGRIK